MTPPTQTPYLVQIYKLDATQENPVLDCFAIQCPDGTSLDDFYELVIRTMKIHTRKPFNSETNG